MTKEIATRVEYKSSILDLYVKIKTAKYANYEYCTFFFIRNRSSVPYDQKNISSKKLRNALLKQSH